MMERRRHEEAAERPGRVEDYTGAALASIYVVVLMILGTIWAAYGFLAALGLGCAAERGLARLARRPGA